MFENDVTDVLIQLLIQNKPQVAQGKHDSSTVLIIEELIDEVTTKIRNPPELNEASPVSEHVKTVKHLLNLHQLKSATTPGVSIPSNSSAAEQPIHHSTPGGNASEGLQSGDGTNISESHISSGNDGSRFPGDSTKEGQINPDAIKHAREDREGSASTVAAEVSDVETAKDGKEKGQGIVEVEARSVS
jgi:hypothetical protein